MILESIELDVFVPKRLCRNSCRRCRGSELLPLSPGAARLLRNSRRKNSGGTECTRLAMKPAATRRDDVRRGRQPPLRWEKCEPRERRHEFRNSLLRPGLTSCRRCAASALAVPIPIRERSSAIGSSAAASRHHQLRAAPELFTRRFYVGIFGCRCLDLRVRHRAEAVPVGFQLGGFLLRFLSRGHAVVHRFSLRAWQASTTLVGSTASLSNCISITLPSLSIR